MENYKNITQPTIEKQKEVDLVPKDKRNWEEKMIYAINHSEVVDERYFNSDSGEPFVMGDKRLNCLIKETSEGETLKKYRSTTIKASQIGVLYDLIEDEMNNKGNIIVRKK